MRAAAALATGHGMRLLRLEVGVRNTDGQALYRRAGFVPCGPFPPYKASPLSLFMKRALVGGDERPAPGAAEERDDRALGA